MKGFPCLTEDGKATPTLGIPCTSEFDGRRETLWISQGLRVALRTEPVLGPFKEDSAQEHILKGMRWPSKEAGDWEERHQSQPGEGILGERGSWGRWRPENPSGSPQKKNQNLESDIFGKHQPQTNCISRARPSSACLPCCTSATTGGMQRTEGSSSPCELEEGVDLISEETLWLHPYCAGLTQPWTGRTIAVP